MEIDKKGGDNGTDGIFVYSGMKMPDIEALNDYNTKIIKEITKFYGEK